MPALGAFVGGMAQGRLQEHAAQDKMKIDEAKIAAQAKAKREGELNKRIASVSQVIEEISARNPDATPGDLRKLNTNLLKMPAKSYAEIEKRVFSSDPEQGYTLTGGRVMGKRKPEKITEPGESALGFAEMALNGGFPQFDKLLLEKGVDRDDFVSAADDNQRAILKYNIATVIQQGLAQQKHPSRSVLEAAPVLARSGRLDKGFFYDSLDLTAVDPPRGVQVDRGGGVRDWSTDNLYSWGGRMWKWLGGPEGPRHNPEGHNPNMWEAAS